MPWHGGMMSTTAYAEILERAYRYYYEVYARTGTRPTTFPVTAAEYRCLLSCVPGYEVLERDDWTGALRVYGMEVSVLWRDHPRPVGDLLPHVDSERSSLEDWATAVDALVEAVRTHDDSPGVWCMAIILSELAVVDATFRPRRLDDLRSGVSGWIGSRWLWRADWIIDEGPYAGEWHMTSLSTPSPLFWAPSGDLEMHELMTDGER
jgi:hypothetical protein